MSNSMKDKIVVITGGGGGIGRACAVRLSREGMRVILLGGRDGQKLDETKNLLSGDTECFAVPGDLTDEAFLESAVERAAERWGGLDVLINNAGMALNAPFEEISMDQYDRIMGINVKAPFFLTQKAIPYLKKSKTATIINIASVVGHLGYPFQSAYVASKHAVLGLTKSIANEYYKDNIRVHAICPGGVYTDMIKVARPDLSEEGMIRPEEIAGIVWFFLANRGNAVVDEINVHRIGKEPFLV